MVLIIVAVVVPAVVAVFVIVVVVAAVAGIGITWGGGKGEQISPPNIFLLNNFFFSYRFEDGQIEKCD
jgi:hypothetical protein